MPELRPFIVRHRPPPHPGPLAGRWKLSNAALRREEDNLLDLRTRELITDEVFVAKSRHFVERRAALMVQLREHEGRASDGAGLVQVFTLAARAVQVLQNGTPVQQRVILETVGLNYTLTARRVAFSFDNPLDRMAEAGGSSNWSGCLDDVRTLIVEKGLPVERFAHALQVMNGRLPELRPVA